MSAGSRKPNGSVGTAPLPANAGDVGRSVLYGEPHPIDPGDDFGRLEPYLPDFAEAALMEGEDTCLLAAICLRETWAGWAPGYSPKGSYLGRGDGGHGRMLFQFDDRGPWFYFVRECPEATPMLQARWVCHILACNRRNLHDFASHPLFERAILAAYNAFSYPVERYAPAKDPIRAALTLGQDPDHVTSGHNYGADVLKRRDRLRELHPDRFPPVRRNIA